MGRERKIKGVGESEVQLYLKGPFGSRGGTSIESRASKRHGPFHHGHTALSNLVFMLVPIRPDIGRNWTSVKAIHKLIKPFTNIGDKNIMIKQSGQIETTA